MRICIQLSPLEVTGGSLYDRMLRLFGSYELCGPVALSPPTPAQPARRPLSAGSPEDSRRVSQNATRFPY